MYGLVYSEEMKKKRKHGCKSTNIRCANKYFMTFLLKKCWKCHTSAKNYLLSISTCTSIFNTKNSLIMSEKNKKKHRVRRILRMKETSLKECIVYQQANKERKFLTFCVCLYF